MALFGASFITTNSRDVLVGDCRKARLCSWQTGKAGRMVHDTEQFVCRDIRSSSAKGSKLDRRLPATRLR